MDLGRLSHPDPTERLAQEGVIEGVLVAAVNAEYIARHEGRKLIERYIIGVCALPLKVITWRAHEALFCRLLCV
jgi:hypothetical protein